MNMEEVNQPLVNGEPMSESDFDALWSKQTTTAPKKAAVAQPKKILIKAPKGSFTLKKYRVPANIEREEYLQALHAEMNGSGWPQYGPLISSRVRHRERTDSLNFYHPDLRRTMELFFSYYGDGVLYVVNGFRSPQLYPAQVHSLGLALDIEASDEASAYRIMNAAYAAGFPTIIPGGDFPNGQGHIHLDLAPKAAYNYGMGVYDGPWS